MGDDVVTESPSVRLLGLHLNSSLTWADHIALLHKKLNQRLALIKRLRPKLDDQHVTQLIHGLMISQVHFAMPIYSKIRFDKSDPVPLHMAGLQLTLNNAMRVALRASKKDRLSIEELCERTGIPSVNQLAVETTLLECWRCLNFSQPCSDFFILPLVPSRSLAGGMFHTPPTKHQENFAWKATKLWNAASPEIQYVERPSIARKFVRDFAFAYRLV